MPRVRAVAALLLAACGASAPPPSAASSELEPEPARVQFNLERASVHDVARVLARMTGRPVVIGSRADGLAECTTISVLHEGTVGVDEAVALARAALQDGPIRLEERGEALVFTTPPGDASSPCQSPPTRPTAPLAQERPVSRSTLDLDAHVRPGARSRSRSEAQVTRAAVDAFLEEPGREGARITPRADGQGRVECLALLRLGGGHLLSRLGFQNGDCVSVINGYDVRSPDAALEAYGRLRDADRLEVVLRRRGQPHTIEITLVESLDP